MDDDLRSQRGFGNDEPEETGSVLGSSRPPVRFDLTKVCTLVVFAEPPPRPSLR